MRIFTNSFNCEYFFWSQNVLLSYKKSLNAFHFQPQTQTKANGLDDHWTVWLLSGFSSLDLSSVPSWAQKAQPKSQNRLFLIFPLKALFALSLLSEHFVCPFFNFYISTLCIQSFLFLVHFWATLFTWDCYFFLSFYSSYFFFLMVFPFLSILNYTFPSFFILHCKNIFLFNCLYISLSFFPHLAIKSFLCSIWTLSK